ncbi:putative neural-cadherin 2 [Scylla paramamosain]|uniref:putative neural-cadherin 2 n=1 Tax=Scylla paramamosain TaxID=85552 RepID=UPI00308276DF
MSEHSVKTGDVRTSGHESINTHTLPYSPGVLFPAATRLLSDQSSPLEFSAPRYCAALPEDSPLAAVVGTLTATHTHGAEIKYSITGGNVGGLFTIDQRSGTVTLAVALDHELSHQHQLEVTAEAGGAAARAQLVVQIGDVNDNAPEFVRPAPRITVIEEDDRDLPATIARVEVVDADSSDAVGLAFRVSGDGVDQLGDGDAFFTINASTGDLIQLRALDRDPPHGRGEWRLRVEVRDGQGSGEEQEATPVLPHSFSPSHLHRQASWGHQDPERDITPTQAWPQYLRSGDAAIGDTGHGRPADGGRKERQVWGRVGPAKERLQDVFQSNRK